jgi:hypothetical protein
MKGKCVIPRGSENLRYRVMELDYMEHESRIRELAMI